MIEQAGNAIGILSGIILIGGALIGVLVYALRKKWNEDEQASADRVLKLAKEEIALLTDKAERVPELEKQVKVLREEVGAARAIAELKVNLEGGFVRVIQALEHHEERARRADAWQQARGDALVEAQNALLAHFHLEPPRVTPPQQDRRG